MSKPIFSSKRTRDENTDRSEEDVEHNEPELLSYFVDLTLAESSDSEESGISEIEGNDVDS
jgi:hypothetical protein